MMTDITVARETQLFFQSILLGAGLSFVYDILRILRKETRHRAISISLEDIFYFFICAVATFGFILKDNSGEIRGYILAGELIGWVICHMTIGYAAVKVFVCVFDIVKKFIFFWGRIIFAPFLWIGKIICRLGRYFKKRLCGIFKKIIQKEKYNLKRKRMMLYNLCIRFKNTRT